MKTLLLALLISSSFLIQDWQVGQWNFKSIPVEEYKLSAETIELTEQVMSSFYLILNDDFTYEMEIKGTIHSGKYKFNKGQTEMTVISNHSGVLKFQILRHDEKEMVLHMFNVYTILIERADS